MDFILSEIFVYPIKSVSGISLNKAKIGEKGIEKDRRWMIINAEGKFISQRSHPELSLIAVKIETDGLTVSHKNKNYDNLFIPYEVDEENTAVVEIWNDKCSAVFVSNAADCWFSKVLGIPCRLVYMPDDTKRIVDPRYSEGNKTVGFADGYPFLLIGQSSLDDLNSKLDKSIKMNRFRPNLVFAGGEPFIEDFWREFKINNITFYPVKPCARCVVTRVDQETGLKGNEPLDTLSSYRMKNNKVYFGQNLISEGSGIINVGDPLFLVK
jgi:uncharacterized protein